jgi:hypothetical protein
MLLSNVKFLLGCLPMTQHQNFEKNIIAIYEHFFYWNFTNFLIKILKFKWFFFNCQNFWYLDFNVPPKYRTMIKIFIFHIRFIAIFLDILLKFLWIIAILATNKNSFEKHCYQPTNLARWETLFIFSIEIKIKPWNM